MKNSPIFYVMRQKCQDHDSDGDVGVVDHGYEMALAWTWGKGGREEGERRERGGGEEGERRERGKKGMREGETLEGW